MASFIALALIVSAASPAAVHRQATQLFDQGQFHQAELFIQTAVEEYEIRFGASSLETGLMLRDLAKAYRSEGALRKAEAVERREIEILRTRLGEDDANMGLALDALAEILIDQGRFTEAGRTLRIAAGKLDSRNPHLATLLNDLGVVCYHDGRSKEAARMFHRSLEIREGAAARANLEVVEQSVVARAR